MTARTPEQELAHAQLKTKMLAPSAAEQLQNARNDVIRRRKDDKLITAEGVAKRNGIKLSEAIEIMAESNRENASEDVETVEPKSYPAELEPLVSSGIAHFTEGYWCAKKCVICMKFILPNEKCGEDGEHPISLAPLVRLDGQTLTATGRRALGLEKPRTAEQIAEERKQSWADETWWSQFRSAGELEGSGNVKMYIENFLPEGITIISGLPKEGKSFLGLAVTKALTTGKPLFGRLGFEVPEITPVLYLAAESGDGALKLRCKKFGITEDKTLFICRTLSQGLMLGLDDPNLEKLVRTMRPAIILETMIRFNDGKDEDSSEK